MVRIIGVLLIVVGLFALATGGLTYTRREKVVDIGPIEATAESAIAFPFRHCSAPRPSPAGSYCSSPECGKRVDAAVRP